MVGVSKESGRSFCTLTPASAAVHVLAICVRKCELASMHTNGQRVRCRLHALVMHICGFIRDVIPAIGNYHKKENNLTNHTINALYF